MPRRTPFLRIAVPTPLRRVFDYLPGELDADDLAPGMRLRVPFGRTTPVGLLLEWVTESNASRLRPVAECIDRHPLSAHCRPHPAASCF